MTVQEIHIDLDYQIQKINSNSTRNVEAKEKDWLFNNEVSKFLASRSRPVSDPKGVGFEGDTKRLKDIKPLVSSQSLEVEVINDKVGRVVLPTFSYKPIRVDCEFFKVCDSSKSKEVINKDRLKYFKFPDADHRFKVVINNGTNSKVLFDTNELPSDYIKGNYFYLVKAFIIEVRNAFENDEFYKDLDFYYQWFGNEFKSDTFFFKGKHTFADLSLEIIEPNSSPRPIGTTIRDKVSQADKDGTSQVKHRELNYKSYTSVVDLTSTARIVNEEMETNKIKSKLSTSLQESPIVSIEKNICTVYNPKNTIIKRIKFVYIETPQQIDVLLNQSLNLDREVIKEIIVNTSRFVKALFDSNNYEKYLKESTLIE